MFWGSLFLKNHIIFGIVFRRRGGNISINLSLFVLLYNTNVMNKLKFNDLKINSLTGPIFFNLQNYFPLRGKVGQHKKKKRVFCLSILFVYDCHCLVPATNVTLFLLPGNYWFFLAHGWFWKESNTSLCTVTASH